MSLNSHAHPLWMASGAALLGTLLGGAAVYMALSNPAAPRKEVSKRVQTVPMARAKGLEERRIAAIAATRDTVVGIKIAGQLVGAGVMLSEEGTLLTNYHLVEPVLLHPRARLQRDSRIPKTESEVVVRFYDGRELFAQIHWADASQDVAVLKLINQRDDERFPSAKPGDSSALRVGQSVFVVGSPVGLEHSVSAGMVSALDREQLLNGRRTTAIQLDANINLGNSGGPLFDLDGRLVGITTTRSRKGDGIGFAIPIEKIEVLFRHYNDRRRWSQLGVSANPDQSVFPLIKDSGYQTGVYVARVAKRGGTLESQTPADQLKAGDVIVAMRGKRFAGATDTVRSRSQAANALQEAVIALVPGDDISLTVVRKGKVRELRIPVFALSPERQVTTGARIVLGMQLKLSKDGIARFDGFVPGNPIAKGYDPEEVKQIIGAKLVEMQGRSFKSLRELGDIFFDLEQQANVNTQRWISLVFEDNKGQRWRVTGYPLLMMGV